VGREHGLDVASIAGRAGRQPAWEPVMPSSKSQRSRRAATLADVGREAGVSAMAASVALNGATTSSRVSDDTRARVLAAAQRLRYRPNATARGLADRRMNTLGLAALLGGDEPNLYFLEVFNGVIKGAAAAGQTVTVFTLDNWAQAQQRIPSFCDGRIDGLILLAPELPVDAVDWLPEHTPVVSVHSNQEIAGIANLESDDEVGAFRMVSHMLGLGHRRILHVGGPTGALGADRRVQGYLRAHADAGLAPPPDHVLRDAFSAEGGSRAIETWLGRHRGAPLPDAVFAASDAIALGCMERLGARGLRVPADISLVGFDDTLLARSSHMATVRQPLGQLGRRAVEVLTERIGAHRSKTTAGMQRSIVLPTEMVLGQTLAAPRSAVLTVA
jgi:LacI family transcriptional regulator